MNATALATGTAGFSTAILQNGWYKYLSQMGVGKLVQEWGTSFDPVAKMMFPFHVCRLNMKSKWFTIISP